MTDSKKRPARNKAARKKADTAHTPYNIDEVLKAFAPGRAFVMRVARATRLSYTQRRQLIGA